ncbi:hypothetical protein [Streptomyces sp. NPDC102264]|uniref:hypothetical protein n=1 Tax=Streptomyces sp. NPDC102264 TaxID=3366149 RepID=UPI00381ACD43
MVVDVLDGWRREQAGRAMTQDGSAAALEEGFFDDLASRVLRSHNTIDNWLSGKAFPADVGVLAEVIAVIGQAAARGGIVVDGDAVLLDPERWRERHDAINRARVREVEQARRGQQAIADLADAETRARRDALTDRPQRLGCWTAAQLRVHPSISGTGSHASGFVLPTYVERPHDQRPSASWPSCANGRGTAGVPGAWASVRAVNHGSMMRSARADAVGSG